MLPISQDRPCLHFHTSGLLSVELIQPWNFPPLLSNFPFLFSLLSYVLREYVQSTHPSSISPARVQILRMKANLMTQRVLPKAGAHSSWQIPQLEQGLEGRCSGRTGREQDELLIRKAKGISSLPFLRRFALASKQICWNTELSKRNYRREGAYKHFISQTGQDCLWFTLISLLGSFFMCQAQCSRQKYSLPRSCRLLGEKDNNSNEELHT